MVQAPVIYAVLHLRGRVELKLITQHVHVCGRGRGESWLCSCRLGLSLKAPAD